MNANLRNIREKEKFAKQHYGPREINKLVIEIISRGACYYSRVMLTGKKRYNYIDQWLFRLLSQKRQGHNNIIFQAGRSNTMVLYIYMQHNLFK